MRRPPKCSRLKLGLCGTYRPKSIKNADLALDTYRTLFSLFNLELDLATCPSVQVMVRADQERKLDVGGEDMMQKWRMRKRGMGVVECEI